MPVLRWIAIALAVLASEAAPAWATGECGSYINSAGHRVASPCGNWHNPRNPVPACATVRCQDGTYSRSEHPNAPGTCSHHGGRAQ